MLELWGRANAYNVQKVTWLLAELGIDYRHHDVGSHPGDLERAEFIALNPHRRIPVLVDGDAVIWESNTVLRYLAASRGAGDWLPAEPYARSRVERWMDWELASLQPDFIALFWSYYRTPEAERDAARIDAARAGCRARMRRLDDTLRETDYLAGERISLADICCAVCLHRYFTMGLDVERPAALWDYYRRLRERNAYRAAVMADYSELHGRSEF